MKISKIELSALPPTQAELLIFLKVNEMSTAEQLNLWRGLVEQYITKESPSELAEEKQIFYYRNLFLKFYLNFWRQQDNLEKKNQLLIDAAREGYDVWLSETLNKLDDNTKKQLVNKANVDRSTPLHMAARHNRIKITQYLIDAGALVTSRDKHHDTPLHLSTSSNAYEVTQLILQKDSSSCAYSGREDRKPLVCAAMNRDLEMIKLLLKENVLGKGDLSLQLQKALEEAEKNQDEKIIEFLKKTISQDSVSQYKRLSK